VRIFPAEKSDRVLRDRGEWSASMLGIDAKAPEGGITMPLIRKIRLGIVRTHMKGIFEEYRKKAPDILKLVNLEIRPPEPRGSKRRKGEKRGRPPLDVLHLARLAKYYVQCCVAGSTRPIADTAKHFDISAGIARTRIHKARAEGILADSERGIAWGRLTPKAQEILRKKGA
jgi:hypothetical protein